MKMNAFIISIIIGTAVFLLIIAAASLQYDKLNAHTRFGRLNPDDWLFHDFYLKVYGALFGNRDQDEIAVKLGINIEKYYKNCDIIKEQPNTKKLIANYIYGIIILVFTVFICIFWNFTIAPIGVIAFAVLVYYEQYRAEKKAEEMKIQIENELPRFLDLLSSELQIGLPVENAIYILCSRFDSLLSREFLETLHEMELSSSGWTQALEKVASKYDIEMLNDFVLDITVSYRKGVSVADSVARKASDIKEKYLLNVKERAGKSQNTILIPIAFFQFLPIMAFLLIPVFLSISTGL